LPIATSTTWIVIASSLALYLLVVAPVVACSVYAIRKKAPDALWRAVVDVERFVELRDHARSELLRTGSLERFVELKDEARKHLWPLDGRVGHAEEDVARQVVPEPRSARRPARRTERSALAAGSSRARERRHAPDEGAPRRLGPTALIRRRP
jgi:hypothetical protein